MQLVINIAKWPEDSPLEHIDTDIIIRDENDEVLFPEEKITGNIFIKDIDIPVGETYYVTEKKNLRLKDQAYDQILQYESIVHTITNDESEISNMLLKEYVYIEKPVIYLKLEDIEESVEFVTIKGSSYRGKGDGHTHSHWVIMSDDEVVFKSFKDFENKTSITVPKYLFDFNSKLEIYLTHCSNQIESETLVHIIKKSEVNFKLVSPLFAQTYNNYNIRISKIDNSKIMRLHKVTLSNKDFILRTFEITNDSNIVNLTVERYFIDKHNNYIIDLYGYDSTNKLVKLSYILEVSETYNSKRYNKNVVMNKVFHNPIINNYGIPSNIHMNKLTIGGSVIPNRQNIFFNSGSLETINNLPPSGRELVGVKHLGTITDMTAYSTGEYEIIDCLSPTGIPTFMVYKLYVRTGENITSPYEESVNNVTASYTLVHMLARPDETKNTSYSNSKVQINHEEIIYSVPGTNKLRKYNHITNKITDLKTLDIPLTKTNGEPITNILLIRMDNNQLLCIPNKGIRAKIYIIDKNKYIDSMSLPHKDLINSRLKITPLPNMDSLVFRSDEEGMSSVLYFDAKKFEFIDTGFILEDSMDISTFLIYDRIYLTKFLPRDYVNYQHDRTRIIKFT